MLIDGTGGLVAGSLRVPEFRAIWRTVVAEVVAISSPTIALSPGPSPNLRAGCRLTPTLSPICDGSGMVLDVLNAGYLVSGDSAWFRGTSGTR